MSLDEILAKRARGESLTPEEEQALLSEIPTSRYETGSILSQTTSPDIQSPGPSVPFTGLSSNPKTKIGYYEHLNKLRSEGNLLSPYEAEDLHDYNNPESRKPKTLTAVDKLRLTAAKKRNDERLDPSWSTSFAQAVTGKTPESPDEKIERIAKEKEDAIASRLSVLKGIPDETPEDETSVAETPNTPTESTTADKVLMGLGNEDLSDLDTNLPTPDKTEEKKKAGGYGVPSFDKDREDARTKYDKAMTDADAFLKTAQGTQQDTLKEVLSKAERIRDRIEASGSYERKMLGYERLGDMMARALANLGAGLQGRKEGVAVSPLKLEAVSQAERYQDLQERAKEGERTASRISGEGEKAYREAMEMLIASKNKSVDKAGRVYAHEMSAADSKERRAERAAASAENRQYLEDQKKLQRERQEEDKLHKQGLQEQNQLLSQLGKEIQKPMEQIELLQKAKLKAENSPDKISKLMQTYGINQSEVDALVEKHPELYTKPGKVWGTNPDDDKAVRALIASKFDEEISGIQKSISPQMEQIKRVREMTPTDYYQSRRKPDMIGKGTETTFKEVTVLHPVTKKQFKIHDAETLEEALATGATIVQ